MPSLLLLLLRFRLWERTRRRRRLQLRQKSGHHVAMKHENEELGIKHFKGEKNEVDCAICICKIESGDLIRELICDHIFHKGCLDRWIGDGYRPRSCPLCRGTLEPKITVTKIEENQELGQETINSSSSFSGSMDHGRPGLCFNLHYW
ncbi:E3 ubiquitin-protein ligase RNF165-like [Telopea speciosissima]|uniref:E3 ubiquitin-protein ligase RNF165-like n=1 Tax=Telopea speciosissima TaxID=54955 RepID=UPI001CC5B3A1|nr:E3 ubiquitin-protein ligase RNF165-like [Telopea speciosissima]